MRWEGIIDAAELRKAINVLKPDRQLFEVRIFGADKRKIISGYFTDCDTLLTQLDKVDPRGKNIYITLNAVDEDLYARTQHDKFVSGVATTSDSDINRYEWLFIDFDPKRPTDISSTDQELEAAAELKETVKNHLTGLGFAAPIEAMSGNGYHLLYRIDLPCSAENTQLISDCLTTLSVLFNTQVIKIDTTNYNPSRICKLYGTLAQKGSHTEKRPHRMSRLLVVPDAIRANDISLLRALTAEMPAEAASQPEKKIARPAKQEFNLREWLASHGLTYKEDVGRDCQMFLLDECPFDPSHRNGDSKIFAYTNGAIAFKCHHNSCRNYKWQDVRKKFEPDAYDREQDDERIEAEYRKHKQQKLEAEKAELIPLDGDDIKAKPKAKEPKQRRKLKTAEGLMNKEIPEPKVYIGVGEEVPFLVEGTCILSAKPKLGKSWLALDMCLAVAFGEDFLGYKTQQCSTLYLDLETSEAIQKKRMMKALNGRPVPKNFYLDTETDTLTNGFVEQIEWYLEDDPNIGIVVVDVFQIIRSESKSMKETEYEHAYRDITPLNELAQKYHIAIILVCHDRKAVDPDDPFSNILGSTGLQGAATQMIVMFRKRKDDPIHISVKGKTIDGLPELNVKLENAEWSIVEGNDQEHEKERLRKEYLDSPIRKAAVTILENQDRWQGRCGSLIQDAALCNIAIIDTAKSVGGFLHKHIGHFLEEDGITVQIISNGTGGSLYKLYRRTVDTVDTVDEDEGLTVDGWTDAYEYGVPEEILL